MMDVSITGLSKEEGPRMTLFYIESVKSFQLKPNIGNDKEHVINARHKDDASVIE
jgi:hypothetical protein